MKSTMLPNTLSTIPKGFLCPITNDVMQNPVIDPEGNSFEETAIKEWLSRNRKSPITRSLLSVHQLIPNRALKGAIEELVFIKTPPENIREVSQNDELIHSSKKVLYREYPDIFDYLTLDLGLSPRLVKVAIEEKGCSKH
jgi:hypothetical protein